MKNNIKKYDQHRATKQSLAQKPIIKPAQPLITFIQRLWS